jgi:hypothetical protein
LDQFSRAHKLAGSNEPLKQPAAPVPKTNYAVGSIEWCREHGVNPEDID